jgi:hypothetical protein
MVVSNFSDSIKIGFLVLVLAVFAFGCGSSKPKDDDVSIPLPGGNRIQLDKSGGKVKITGEGGDFEIQSSEGGVEYPAVLEDEFPPCPGCKPVQVTNIGGQIGVMLNSSRSADEAYEFYIGKIRSAGYKVEMDTQSAGMRMFMAENDGKQISFTAGANEDGSIIVSIRYYDGE